jgi:hypothetical protein
VLLQQIPQGAVELMPAAASEFRGLAQKAALQCKIVNACFFSKHLDYETPHPTSFLGHLLPKGEGRVFLALSRGERVSAMCRRVRGQSTDFGCGSAVLRFSVLH